MSLANHKGQMCFVIIHRIYYCNLLPLRTGCHFLGERILSKGIIPAGLSFTNRPTLLLRPVDAINHAMTRWSAATWSISSLAESAHRPFPEFLTVLEAVLVDVELIQSLIRRYFVTYTM
jgi:hypothetical protein